MNNPMCSEPSHDYGRADVCLTCFEESVRESMKPECTCGHDDLEYIFHFQDCKQGAFLKSQDKTEWMDIDEI